MICYNAPKVHNSLRCLMSNWCLAAQENALAAVLSAVCLSMCCENCVQRSSAGCALSVGAHCSVCLLSWLENNCCRANWVIDIKCYQ